MNEMKKIQIGERIQKRRKELGLNQKELAKEMNLSQKQISKYENNESKPPIDQLQKLANILNVSIEWLINDTIEIKKSGGHVNANTLGGRIRIARENKNLNQKKFSEILNIPVHVLGKIEHGDKPEKELLDKIALELDVSVDYLITGIANKLPDGELSEQQKEILKIMQHMTDNEQNELLGAVKMYLRI